MAEKPAVTEADWEAFFRACPPRSRLGRMVEERTGYMNTDSYFGFEFPEDLDEYDKAKGHQIPAGMVAVTFGFGDPHAEHVLVPEEEFAARVGREGR